MLAIKGFIFTIFSWLVLTTSSGISTDEYAVYQPEEHIVALDNTDQAPLFFDAVLEVSQVSTYELPTLKILTQFFQVDTQFYSNQHYPLSYYEIGQNIMVGLCIKTIIFPFHCFT